VGDVIDRRRRATSESPFEPQIGFSRAVRVGRHIAVAATAAIWPDGRVVDDAGAQARRCLEIIGQALEELDASLDDVVRTRVFLVDPADGPIVGRVHGEVLGTVRPATGFYRRGRLPRSTLAGRDRGGRDRGRLERNAVHAHRAGVERSGAGGITPVPV
jgi:enamine deaminase RidA (YjgF/YER057c/UK114 family)